MSWRSASIHTFPLAEPPETPMMYAPPLGLPADVQTLIVTTNPRVASDPHETDRTNLCHTMENVCICSEWSSQRRLDSTEGIKKGCKRALYPRTRLVWLKASTSYPASVKIVFFGKVPCRPLCWSLLRELRLGFRVGLKGCEEEAKADMATELIEANCSIYMT